MSWRSFLAYLALVGALPLAIMWAGDHLSQLALTHWGQIVADAFTRLPSYTRLTNAL